jgi:hypothetical protein
MSASHNSYRDSQLTKQGLINLGLSFWEGNEPVWYWRGSRVMGVIKKWTTVAVQV